MQSDDKTKISNKAKPSPGQILRALGWFGDIIRQAPAEERMAHGVVVAGLAVALRGNFLDPTDWKPMALLGLCVACEAAIVFMRRRLSDSGE